MVQEISLRLQGTRWSSMSTRPKTVDSNAIPIEKN